MRHTIERCMRCKQRHEDIEVELTEDSRGRPRVRYVCPVTGHAVSVAISGETRDALVSSGAKTKTRRKPREDDVKKDTTLTKGQQWAVKMGVDPVFQPRLAALYDVAHGVVDRWEQDSRAQDTESVVARRVESLKAAAKGSTNDSDDLERQLGFHLGEVLGLVLVERGYGAANVMSVLPREVLATQGESSAPESQEAGWLIDADGNRTYLGAAVDFGEGLAGTDFDGDGDIGRAVGTVAGAALGAAIQSAAGAQ